MPDQYRSGDKFHDLSAIDSRLAELEREKQQLIALRAELRNSKTAPPLSDSFSPEQKIAIFRNLFRGRTDIFANRWQNQRGRSGYSVACDKEWVQGVCNKPRIKCVECTHRHVCRFCRKKNRSSTLDAGRVLAVHQPPGPYAPCLGFHGDPVGDGMPQQWILRFSALPKRWIRVTAPVRAVAWSWPAFLIRCVAITR